MESRQTLLLSPCMLAWIQGCMMTSCAMGLFSGFLFRRMVTRSLASWDTRVHSLAGKSRSLFTIWDIVWLSLLPRKGK